MTERIRICVLGGDGIGPEVVRQGLRVLKALGLSLELEEGEIGLGCYQRQGTPLPAETIEKVRRCDATLLGAVTTPPHVAGYRSPVVGLRQELDLYANVRPCRSLPGTRAGVDLVVVRENTEGLYIGRERIEEEGRTAISERVITQHGSERIARFAFELAKREGRSQVTVVHKANILRETCGLFLRTAEVVAGDFPDISMESMLVDTAAMQLIRQPEQFDVIVTTNLFGDILSDEACALVGGLGLAFSGNIGSSTSVFEPVHGSAPDIAGQNLANPLASILSCGMMLRHLGRREEAERLQKAVEGALSHPNLTTPDLGGSLTTSEFADRVIGLL